MSRTTALRTEFISDWSDSHTWKVLIVVFCKGRCAVEFTSIGQTVTHYSLPKMLHLRRDSLPPETNGSIGHTTKTLVVSPVRQSTCRGDGLPSDMTAETARLRREKHVILIMNVNGFAACFRWGDGNWGIVRLNRNSFSSLVLAEFKMEMRQTEAKL